MRLFVLVVMWAYIIVIQRQTAVSAYLKSKQLLLFTFEWNIAISISDFLTRVFSDTAFAHAPNPCVFNPR